MAIRTCSVSFGIIVCRYFSKWRIKMSKNWKRLHPPPHSLNLTAYPTPGKVAPSMKMTAKDVKEITCMPLLTFFSVLERPGKNRKGVATTPLVRRGLKLWLETTLICILLSASRDVYFDKRMVCFLSALKSTSESKLQRKAYHLKDTALLCDF